MFLPGIFYKMVFQAQFVFYTVLVVSAFCNPAKLPRWITAGISFAMLNVAAWVAFWVWISGRASKSWGTVNYPVKS